MSRSKYFIVNWDWLLFSEIAQKSAFIKNNSDASIFLLGNLLPRDLFKIYALALHIDDACDKNGTQQQCEPL